MISASTGLRAALRLAGTGRAGVVSIVSAGAAPMPEITLIAARLADDGSLSVLAHVLEEGPLPITTIIFPLQQYLV